MVSSAYIYIDIYIYACGDQVGSSETSPTSLTVSVAPSNVFFLFIPAQGVNQSKQPGRDFINFDCLHPCRFAYCGQDHATLPHRIWMPSGFPGCGGTTERLSTLPSIHPLAVGRLIRLTAKCRSKKTALLRPERLDPRMDNGFGLHCARDTWRIRTECASHGHLVPIT